MRKINFLKFGATIFTAMASTVAFALPSGGPFPKIDGPIAVTIEHFEPSMWKLAFGQYLIPGTSFIYSDRRQNTDAAKLSSIFGPIGVAITASALSSEAAKNVDGKVTRLPNLDEIVTRILQERDIKTLGKNFEISQKVEGKPRIDISPRGFLTTGSDDLTKYMVFVEVRAYEASGTLIWWNKYAYSGKAEAKPLTGTGSWMEDEGKPLQKMSEEGLPLIMSSLTQDLIGAPGLPDKEIKFKNCLKGVKTPLFLIEESPDYWIIKNSQSAGIGSTTSIFSKSVCALEE